MTSTASGAIHGKLRLAKTASTRAMGNATQPTRRIRRRAVGRAGACRTTSPSSLGPMVVTFTARRRQASLMRIAVAVAPPIAITYTTSRATVTSNTISRPSTARIVGALRYATTKQDRICRLRTNRSGAQTLGFDPPHPLRGASLRPSPVGGSCHFSRQAGLPAGLEWDFARRRLVGARLGTAGINPAFGSTCVLTNQLGGFDRVHQLGERILGVPEQHDRLGVV